MTMMTVGYGDIVPQNSLEMVFTVITIFGGCIIVGYNINQIGNIFKDMGKENKKIQDNIAKINKFMDSKAINRNLQMRIRAYLKFAWVKQDEKLNTELLNMIDSLSDPLKEELYLEGYGDIVRNYPLFANNFSYDFLSCLIREMKEQTFMKNDLIFEQNQMENHNLYFIITGEIEIFRLFHENHPPVIFTKLKEKEMIGEYSFMTGFRQIYSAKASKYTKVYKISHQNFIEVLNKFPNDYEKYCEIKDQIILYKNYEKYNMRCLICNQKNHMNNHCNLIHFVPNKGNVILKYLYSEDQTRNTYKRKTRQSFHPLMDRLKITNKIKVFQSHFKKKSNSDSEDSSLSKDSHSVCSEQNIPLMNKNHLINGKKSIIKIKEPIKIVINDQNIDEKTDNTKNLSIKIKEIEPDEPFLQKSSKQFLDRNFHLDPRRTTTFMNKKKPNFYSNNPDLDFEHVKIYKYYFPQGNMMDFIEVFQKRARSNTNKKTIFLEENKNNTQQKRTGYSFSNKTFLTQEKEKRIIKMEKGFLSDNENLKDIKKSSLFKFSPVTRSQSFFKKKKIIKPTFFQIVNELKDQKVNKGK